MSGQTGDKITVRAGVETWFTISLRLKEDMVLEEGDVIEVWENSPFCVVVPPEGVEDYVVVQVSADGEAEFAWSFEFPRAGMFPGVLWSQMYLGSIEITSGKLFPGDTLNLLAVDTGGQGYHLITPLLSGFDSRLDFVLLKGGSGQSSEIISSVEVNVTGGRATELVGVLPSRVVAGEPFSLLVRAEDRFFNVADGYTGAVDFDAPGVTGLPDSYTFTENDKGVHLFEGLTCGSPGVFTVYMEDPVSGITGESNPVEVSASEPSYRVWWGDLHCHQYDGYELPLLIDRWDPRKTYARARDVYGLDFLAVTPHTFYHSPELPETWWPYVKEGARENYLPGEFVTFTGYEWRGGAGDHNVIFPGDDYEILEPVDNWNVEVLYEKAAGVGALVIPHVGGMTADLSYHDERVQRLVEISSMHRHSEWFGQQALQNGLEVGFVGSGDDHIGRCGGRTIMVPGTKSYPADLDFKNGYSNNSIAAVLATELTREAVFEALMERRTYATTGARIILDFTVNDAVMGSKITSEDYPVIKVHVVGTDELDVVEVIRNQKTIETVRGNGAEADFTYTDPDPPEGTNAYYVRVTQVDEEIAWSSPVYVEQGPVVPLSIPIERAWNYNRDLLPDLLDAVAAMEYYDEVKSFLENAGGDRLIPFLVPKRVVHSMEGDYVVYTSRDINTGNDLRIEYMLGLPYRTVRITRGYMHYGQYRE